MSEERAVAIATRELLSAKAIGDALADLPASPGLYAWWQTPAALPGAPGTPHPDVDLELLYVGIAPDKPREARRPPQPSDLRTRITKNHLSRSIGSSTLRRGLAAFLWQSSGWTPNATSSGRPSLGPVHADALTAWMTEHLHLAVTLHAQPWLIERRVIAAMRPPLNSKHNKSHSFYDKLRTQRAAFASAARASHRPR